ncbi:protein piccolo isoform X2 [Aricia agestis]|nr:protein piccolo isoform X2 [Aricia agestis]
MLERLRVQPLSTQHNYVQLTVQKAVSLLDKLYDTFFTRARKAHVNYFSKPYIKIEFLDKACRPIYKEFDKWPRISLEHDLPKENKEKKEKNKVEPLEKSEQKMTRKSRPSRKAGYCEMCNTDYVDAALHRRSPHHLAFVRDHTNFIALDSLISSGADVATFLDKATPVNGERRSLRKLCNGDAEKKRTKQSQSPDLNGSVSPKRNGLEEERKHNTRCSKRTSESQPSEDRQYYKVVGVSTKLRSSGGFAKQKESSPTVNGTKPIVVKFRKVRRSELSVLSDEAEQFMFPKRASSTSSSSSDDDDKDDALPLKRKTPPQPPPSIERQRQARPIALKEESSEEDMWPEDKRRRKRKVPPVAKRSRRVSNKPPLLEVAIQPPEPEPKVEEAEIPPSLTEETPQPEAEISPLREEPIEKCMKWEDGKLKYTPAVEQLEFAFESVPKSEPWFETFKRQDQNKVVAKNVPRYFALYSKSPKLPYEIGQLPPLKPNCCPLSDLVKQREEKPGPSRSYGTRGMKKEKMRKRTAAILALESHPRKSPREHASTLAILGSAGLLHRRRNGDDAKSTASEDTLSDTHSHLKIELPLLSENQEASERLQQFLSEVFDDPADLDVCDELLDNNTNIIVGKDVPDVSSLVSECEGCDIIRNEIDATVASQPKSRRGKFKKKNKTGWPNKRKTKKNSSASSTETDLKTESTGRSSIEPPDDETTQSSISEEDTILSETEKDESTVIEKSDNDSRNSTVETMDVDSEGKDSEDQPLKHTLRKSKLDLKNSTKDDKTSSQSSEDSQDKDVKQKKKKGLDRLSDWPKDEEQSSKLTLRKSKVELKDSDKDDDKTLSNSSEESEDKEKSRKKRKNFDGMGGWLQPIVRVARVDPNAGRRLRSAGRVRGSRFR